MKTVTTLEELLPLVQDAKTCKEFGAITIAHVPQHLKKGLALAARDALGRTWADGTVQNWLQPGNHTEEHAERQRAAGRKATPKWRAIPENAERNRKASRKAQAAWRAIPENAERQRQAVAAWHKANPEYRAEYNAEYNRNRRANDPAFKIVNNLRTRLWWAVKAGVAMKSASTLELTGCTIEELMQHLETQFQPDMTWENYGEWHIDHIRPCASFDLTDPEQQRECFAWSNLQPLWGAENMSKGAKLDWAAE